MLHYTLYLKNPSSHYIYVDLTIDAITEPTLELQLPAWRPGRYELGNFAKNIKHLEVFDEENNPLSYSKSNKDLWVVNTNGFKKIKVTYSYYTSEINAGNCYADETVMYVNPVHLCLYVPNRMNETHQLELQIPADFKIATSLKQESNILIAESFDELADAPFIASNQLQTQSYEVDNKVFWLHFNGECRPDFEKIKTDFIKFTKTQINFWGDFPVTEYHFMFLVLPFKFYHGVEHQKSTVIAIGPGYALNTGATYESLLGVSSHELFHTWNIKYIRPVEMLPYDFTKENYAKTGYVYEGFTTYYGDVLLLTSGVFSVKEYFDTLEERLVKHFHNYGRFNLAVADSSWDTWLDGYVPGAPYRKTSIYDEGNLIAFMLDVYIMKHSENKHSLRDVCRTLYNDFGKKNKGYTEENIKELCNSFAGVSLKDFFDKYVYGTDDFETPLNECFSYLDIELIRSKSNHVSESVYGFKTIDFGMNRKVSLVAPYSPSWKAGLSIGDEILAINGITFKNDFNDWMTYFEDLDIELMVSSSQKIKHIKLLKSSRPTTYFDTIKLKQKDELSTHFAIWLNSNS